MKKLILLLPFLTLIHTQHASAKGWNDPHIPSNLEWFVMELNSQFRSPCFQIRSSDYCTGVQYAVRESNTIGILITTRGKVPLSEYEAELETAMKVINIRAKFYGLPTPQTEVIRLNP
jgi:hypothetical protein